MLVINKTHKLSWKLKNKLKEMPKMHENYFQTASKYELLEVNKCICHLVNRNEVRLGKV